MKAIANFFTNPFGTNDAAVSLFLAKAFGIYLVIVSIWLLMRGDLVRGVIKSFEESPGLQVLGAIYALILGILLVVGHNIWVFDWPVIITFLGWLTLLKGIVRLFIPDCDKKCVPLFVKGKFFFVWGIFCLALGIILLWKGFW